jgi:hypothetical protein
MTEHPNFVTTHVSTAITLFADPFGVRHILMVHAPCGSGEAAGVAGTSRNFLRNVEVVTGTLPFLRPLGLDLLVLKRDDRALAGGQIAPGPSQ